jgi:hypothetical protein
MAAAGAASPKPATRRTAATVAAVDILAGFCSGINVTLVGHPLETIKVRLQTQPSPPNHMYDGVLDCVRKTIKWEGPMGLYKGVGAPLGGQLFFRSLLFGVYAKYLAVMTAPAAAGAPPRALSLSLIHI